MQVIQTENEVNICLRNITEVIASALAAGAKTLSLECALQGENSLSLKFQSDGCNERIFTYIIKHDDVYQTFMHAALKDYILWFTAFGSPELELDIERFKDVTMSLQGLEQEVPEIMPFGHVFPENSSDPDTLFQKYGNKAAQYYCKKFIKTGTLPHFPEISYQAVFCVEGDKVKAQVNPMLIKAGGETQAGAYSPRERYGVWLCKDFLPVARKNEWISKRQLRTTDFHAFFNCQALVVNAQGNSVANTPQEILNDMENEIKSLTAEIAADEDQNQFEWLVGCVCSGL